LAAAFFGEAAFFGGAVFFCVEAAFLVAGLAAGACDFVTRPDFVLLSTVVVFFSSDGA